MKAVYICLRYVQSTTLSPIDLFEESVCLRSMHINLLKIELLRSYYSRLNKAMLLNW